MPPLEDGFIDPSWRYYMHTCGMYKWEFVRKFKSKIKTKQERERERKICRYILSNSYVCVCVLCIYRNQKPNEDKEQTLAKTFNNETASVKYLH
jgi:hypothetical protein